MTGNPHLHSVDIKPDIIPQSHCDFPVLMSLSTGGAFKVALTWREGEEKHAETQCHLAENHVPYDLGL